MFPTDTEVDISELRRQLTYSPETGELRWCVRKKGVKFGAVAGSVNADGYRVVKINQKPIMAHRIAFALTYNRWPAQLIDHRDGDKANNALRNLREASTKQNNENSKTPITNKTGFKGVFKRYNRYPLRPYEARIVHHGRPIHLGNFATAEEASEAYQQKRLELFTHHRS